jgi:hypothetical protein
VEVRGDFPLNINFPYSQSFGSVGSAGYCSPPSNTNTIRSGVKVGSPVGNGQSQSGIRFWCGEFCIEVDVVFSCESLSQLIRTLQGLQNPNPNPNPNPNSTAVDAVDEGIKVRE